MNQTDGIRTKPPACHTKSAERYVLVLFGGNAVSYNAATAFTNSSYLPVCLLPANASKLYRFSNRFARFERSRHPWSSPRYTEELVAFVRSLGMSRPVLTFLTNDQSVHYWITNEERLSPYCEPAATGLGQLHDKRNFFAALSRHDIDHPRVSDLGGREPESFPVVVKPAYKDRLNRFVKTFGSKALIVETAAELRQFEDFGAEALICQEYVDYDMGDEYSWWGYRSPRDEVYSVTVNHRTKFPDKTGRVSHVRLVSVPEVKRLGDRIVTKLDYRGIADIQFIHDRRTGRFEVIEMNPRLWCSHELLLMANINLVRLCAEDYYASDRANPADFLSALEQPEKTDWYSVLYNLGGRRRRPAKCTEHYQWHTDTLLTRLSLRAYYLAKLAYYRLTRRV